MVYQLCYHNDKGFKRKLQEKCTQMFSERLIQAI